VQADDALQREPGGADDEERWSDFVLCVCVWLRCFPLGAEAGGVVWGHTDQVAVRRSCPSSVQQAQPADHSLGGQGAVPRGQSTESGAAVGSIAGSRKKTTTTADDSGKNGIFSCDGPTAQASRMALWG
jgi:hypothetical protein